MLVVVGLSEVNNKNKVGQKAPLKKTRVYYFIERRIKM